MQSAVGEEKAMRGTPKFSEHPSKRLALLAWMLVFDDSRSAGHAKLIPYIWGGLALGGRAAVVFLLPALYRSPNCPGAICSLSNKRIRHVRAYCPNQHCNISTAFVGGFVVLFVD